LDLPDRKARASDTSPAYSSGAISLGAGAGAALDLIEQAGPRPVLEIAVVAGAQQEGALEGVDGAVHRPDAGEGAVVVAPALARAAMLDELRRLVVGGEQDVGQGLVVPHQHVVAGLELLDQVGFEEKRLGLRGRGDEFHGGGLADHPGDAVGMGLPPGIGADPRLQALGLAHVENVPPAVEHPVDPGRVGKGGPEPLDHLRAPLDQAGIGLQVELHIGAALQGDGAVVLLVVQDLGRNVVIGVAAHGGDLGA
jgi:hypothetical protein